MVSTSGYIVLICSNGFLSYTKWPVILSDCRELSPWVYSPYSALAHLDTKKCNCPCCNLTILPFKTSELPCLHHYQRKIIWGTVLQQFSRSIFDLYEMNSTHPISFVVPAATMHDIFHLGHLGEAPRALFVLLNFWLVVLTIFLKNWESMGRIIPYILENESHVWNHQPDFVLIFVQSLDFFAFSQLKKVVNSLGSNFTPKMDTGYNAKHENPRIAHQSPTTWPSTRKKCPLNALEPENVSAVKI